MGWISDEAGIGFVLPPLPVELQSLTINKMHVGIGKGRLAWHGLYYAASY
jgi:hypothetical protein